MRIVQVLPTLSMGDAVGNVVIALHQALKQCGYQTEIYAKRIDERLPEQTAVPVEAMEPLRPEDVMIYHLSTGDDLNYEMAGWTCRKILHYHNITPPEYFAGYHVRYETMAEEGLQAARFLADKVEYCLADSEFNRQDLLRMGYHQRIDVLPILIPFEDYRKCPDDAYLQQFQDGKTNLLFVGRIAPNKKQEDIIQAFFYYKTYYNANSRLILAGSFRDMEVYQQELQTYAKALGVCEDVVFTGHIRFEEILACYHAADIFVCMSGHEGFCVPVAEAMYFGLPVVAYQAAAVPDTLGEGGLLLTEKNPKLAAAAIDRLITDKHLTEVLAQRQKERLAQLDYDKTVETFVEYIRMFLGERE